MPTYVERLLAAPTGVDVNETLIRALQDRVAALEARLAAVDGLVAGAVTKPQGTPQPDLGLPY